jgi:FdhD protein
MNQHIKAKKKTPIFVVEKDKITSKLDQIATEEPLEIRLNYPKKTIAITMRTPGNDFDLAVGFLYTEGIINGKDDLIKISYCVDKELEEEQKFNIVNIELKDHIPLNLKSLERHFFTNSSCGVCGKASIDNLKIRGCEILSNNHQQINPEIIYKLPDKLREAQGIFTATGGLHASGLFDLQGNLIKIREDVGRHNALDKLIGSSLLANELPLNNQIIMVSGRTSFEIVQKCLTAKVPILCAVSAPSSLAIALAQEFNLTLIGFLRGHKFNLYSGFERIIQNYKL